MLIYETFEWQSRVRIDPTWPWWWCTRNPLRCDRTFTDLDLYKKQTSGTAIFSSNIWRSNSWLPIDSPSREATDFPAKIKTFQSILEKSNRGAIQEGLPLILGLSFQYRLITDRRSVSKSARLGKLWRLHWPTTLWPLVLVRIVRIVIVVVYCQSYHLRFEMFLSDFKGVMNDLSRLTKLRGCAEVCRTCISPTRTTTETTSASTSSQAPWLFSCELRVRLILYDFITFYHYSPNHFTTFHNFPASLWGLLYVAIIDTKAGANPLPEGHLSEQFHYVSLARHAHDHRACDQVPRLAPPAVDRSEFFVPAGFLKRWEATRVMGGTLTIHVYVYTHDITYCTQYYIFARNCFASLYHEFMFWLSFM